MIRVDRADGVRLVTDPIRATHHSMKHAPTEDEGKRVALTTLRTRRADRYIQSRRLTK